MRLAGCVAVIIAVSLALSNAHGETKKPRKEKPQAMGRTDTVVYKKVGDTELTLEVDLPEGTGPFPVMVYVHGGGWSGGNAGQFRAQSCHLTFRGIAGVRINYRKIPQGGNFTDTMQDVLDAVDFVRKNADKYGFDLERLGLAGGSAGGHLSAIAAQRTPECICYVGFNGAYDLVNRDKSRFPREKALQKFLGEVTPEKLKDASAIYQIKTPPPDTLLLHGTADTTIDCQQAVRFAEAIRKKGGNAEVKLYEGEKHGFFNPGRPQYQSTLKAFEDHLVRVFGLD